MNYEKRIKKMIIEDFIKENGFAPSSERINEIYFEKEKEYAGIEKYGFSGLLLEGEDFQEVSSIQKENKSRKYLKEDLEYQRWQAREIESSTLNLLKGYLSNLEKSLKKLDTEELRINNLLAMKGKYNFFNHAIYESFENQNKILFNDSSNILAENGYVTIAGWIEKDIDLKNKKVKVKFESSDRIKNEIFLSDPSNITYHNDRGFKCSVESNGPSDEVKCFVTIDLNSKEYIGSIKMFAKPFRRNGLVRYKIHYSVDGENFKALNSFYKAVDYGENFSVVGIEGIKKIRIELKKNKADFIEDNTNTYIFGIDTIEMNQSKMEKNSKAEVILGPYEVRKKSGELIDFSLATLSDNTCCIIPEKTSISFFLSKDKENWKFIEREESGNNYVRFGNLEYNNKEKIEQDRDVDSFCLEDYTFIDNSKESLFNLNLNSEEFGTIDKDSILIERDIFNPNKRNSGWIKATNSYSCWIYIDELEGRTIDFGSSYCNINDRVRTGKVHFAKGYHKFKTSSQNWKALSRDVNTLEELQESDTLYPYNHKYLIEGFKYKKNFSGEKIYSGVTKVMSRKLSFLPFAKFNEMGSEDHFTIFEKNKKLYFKTKIETKDMSWKNSDNNVIIYKSENGSSELYIKAVLETKKENVAPHINSISVKVI